MNFPSRPSTAYAFLLWITLSISSSSVAAEPKADIELDPLAYALEGSSVHVGIHTGRLRADLGAFSLEVPSAFHGNEGFTQSMAGAGAKLDYFPFAKRTGFFAGIEASFVRSTIVESASKMAERTFHINAGVRAGYRIDLSDALFVSPWVGLGYATGRDVMLAGKRFTHSHLTVFPTIHVGYRF